jgi:hypothetical protein
MLRMFRIYVASVLFRIYVASVLSGCCICFAMAFQIFSEFFASVLYVTNASSACFISRLGVAQVAMAPVVGEQQPAAGLRRLPRTARLASLSLLSSPSPHFPSFPSISP